MDHRKHNKILIIKSAELTIVILKYENFTRTVIRPLIHFLFTFSIYMYCHVELRIANPFYASMMMMMLKIEIKAYILTENKERWKMTGESE